MKLSDVSFEPRHRWKVLILAVIATVAIAFADSYAGHDASLAILYVIPLGAAALYLPGVAVILWATTAAFLRNFFGPQIDGIEVLTQFAIGFFAYAGVGLFAAQLSQTRRKALEVRRQETLRREAEQEARVLIDSSPAAIMTVAQNGTILVMNDAARELLHLPPGSAQRPATDYLPILETVLKSKTISSYVRTMVEGTVRNSNGDAFFAQIWVSSYETTAGRRIAVILSDVSEQVRDREELGLRQLLTSSRIVAGAVSHEVRNLSGAAQVLHTNLTKTTSLPDNHDFRALGSVLASLHQIATAQIPSADDRAGGVDVKSVIDELRIILDGAFRDQGIAASWEVSPNLPPVRAERSALIQVLLNLAQNAARAMEELAERRLTVAAYAIEGTVLVTLKDSGPGVSSPERLFRPFQPGAESTGLGLYVSRAIMRTFGGELTYRRDPVGQCFVVQLPTLNYAEARRA